MQTSLQLGIFYYYTTPTPPRARLNDSSKLVIIEELVGEDLEIPADQRTAKIYEEIANSVSSCVAVTTDCPSNNNSGFMPVLDIQMKVIDGKVVYKFYKKPMSNQRVILAESAVPMNVKRSTLAQEGIRRLRNTQRSLQWEVKADILSEFSQQMKISGYNERFRGEIIRSAVIGFERQCEAADRGTRPLFRPREFQQEQRRRTKLMARSSWHRPKANVVGFYPGSPGGKLAKQIQTIVTEETARLGMTAKIVETGGRTLKSQLVRLDLTGCVYRDICPVCLSETEGASHTRSGVLYSGTCQICLQQGKVSRYWGESGHSAQVRTSQHVDALRRRDKSNAFHKHLEIFHPENTGDVETFKFKSEQTFKKSLEDFTIT